MFAEGNAVVVSGNYGAGVDVAGWPTGKVEVWVAFQTILSGNIKQPEEVVSRFGEQGEMLEGSNITRAGSKKPVETTATLVL
jgi:hypothetical protein